MNVGITQRIEFIAANNEYRDSVDQRLIEWVVSAGFTPVPIPNSILEVSKLEDKCLESWLVELDIQALILSGGPDIGKFPKRDDTESFLLSWADKFSKPVLGICRGMQMMGYRYGVKLSKVDGHVKKKHGLIIPNINIKLPESVNSFHNLALNNIPDNFSLLASSSDESIEAMKHDTLPWEGWMWHPERDSIFNDCELNRVRSLFNSEKK